MRVTLRPFYYANTFDPPVPFEHEKLNDAIDTGNRTFHSNGRLKKLYFFILTIYQNIQS